MRYFLSFLIVSFLLPVSVVAQTTDPDTTLLREYKLQARMSDTLEYKAGEFKEASYSISDLGKDFTIWIQKPVQRMKKNPNLQAIVFSYHDEIQWRSKVRHGLQDYLQLGDTNDLLNSQVSQHRAWSVARELTKCGIAGERIKTRPVLEPNHKRSVKIVLLHKPELRKIIQVVAGLRKKLEKLEGNQDKIRKDLQANAESDSIQSQWLNELTERVDSLAQATDRTGDCCFLKNWQFTLGVAGTVATFPYRVSRESVYLTPEFGIGWKDHAYVFGQYGISPFMGKVAYQPAEDTDPRARFISLSAAYLFDIGVSQIGPEAGWQRMWNKLPEEVEHNWVNELSGAIVGIRWKAPLADNLHMVTRAYWMPGSVDWWNEDSETRFTEFRASVGLAYTF